MSTTQNFNLTDVNGLNMTSTISKPNMKKLTTAIALILLDQIEEDASNMHSSNSSVDADWNIFNEDRYIREKQSALPENVLEKLSRKPTVEDIESFMTAIYECAEFSPECNVLSLLYINRLIAFTGLPLHSGNWRPLVFISLIVAQKVWDDRYLGNLDFAYIYPFFTLEEVNQLEAKFLSLLQFNVVVKPSTYAKYYFELRSFFKTNPDDLKCTLPPLNDQGAHRLARNSTLATEQISQKYGQDSRAVTIH